MLQMFLISQYKLLSSTYAACSQNVQLYISIKIKCTLTERLDLIDCKIFEIRTLNMLQHFTANRVSEGTHINKEHLSAQRLFNV